MKTIGLLGGMSWESTLGYYQTINQLVKESLGGLHSAKIILNSIDFAEIEKLQQQENWQATAEILSRAAKNIELAGADFLLICTNTMHKVAPEIAQAINIPIIHIADATAEHIIKQGFTKVALLGTAYTMQQDFYKGRLINNYGLSVMTPDENDQKVVHQVIYNELCLGRICQQSKNNFLKIINKLSEQGAQAIILGCTEIGLLIKQQDTEVPLFDTSYIHAKKAVELAIFPPMK
ncbi:MAG: aspartate/glutamate racemase family protein [Colwellia sp.]|nr:aspartate/glutamate racemase family protein [Colwellia sp.]